MEDAIRLQENVGLPVVTDGEQRRLSFQSQFAASVPERLAVSPQCGFSNSVMGNAVTPADQERKLRLVVETARRVWGEDTALVSSS